MRLLSCLCFLLLLIPVNDLPDDLVLAQLELPGIVVRRHGELTRTLALLNALLKLLLPVDCMLFID